MVISKTARRRGELRGEESCGHIILYCDSVEQGGGNTGRAGQPIYLIAMLHSEATSNIGDRWARNREAVSPPDLSTRLVNAYFYYFSTSDQRSIHLDPGGLQPHGPRH